MLKQNAPLLYLEHVRSQWPVGGGLQDAITPIYRRPGCHPNCSSIETISRYFVIDEAWQRGLLA